MTQDELKKIVLEIIREIAPEADVSQLEADVKFRDQFEFGSVDFLNFATKLQERLKITISEADCTQLATLAGCLSYLARRTS